MKFGVMTVAFFISQRIFSTICGVMVGIRTPSSPRTGSMTVRPPGARRLSMQRVTLSICFGQAMKPE